LLYHAGYRCTWFKLLERMQWDFVGRVRHQTFLQKKGTATWFPVKRLYIKATRKAEFVFSGLLAKSNAVACHFYMIKEPHKHRLKKNLKGKKIESSMSKKHEKRGREPLLLTTSLSPTAYTPNEIINIYKKRMQIEEAFRDLKNTKNGLSLRHCRSFSIERLNVALLIGNIAALLLWLVGLSAKNKQVHFSFQANTVRSENVLSTFMIGWQYLKKKGKYIAQPDFQKAIRQLQHHAFTA
jgi:hypothetical protein